MDALSVVRRLAGGKLLDDLATALATVAEAVVETGSPGTVTVRFKVSNKGAGDAFVLVEEAVARAMPKRDARGSYFYAVDGELHRDDPRQEVMAGFREVDRQTGEVRSPSQSGATVREVSS